MENLDWVEWSPVTSPLTFNVTQHGVFPENITTIELSRDADLRLIAIGKGWGTFWLDENIKLRAGESASDFYRQETIGKTKLGDTVRLMGVLLLSTHMEHQNLKVKNTNKSLSIKALVSEAEVIQTDFPISTQIEWIVNFSTEDYILNGQTKREKLLCFKRERNDGNVIERYPNKNVASIFDHFKCECIVSQKKLSLVVGHVIEEVASKRYKPGFLEFDSLNSDQLPSTDTKQNILAALSFALGRQLISVGSTSLSQNSDRIGFTAIKIHKLGDNDYRQPSYPAIPLGFSHAEWCLDNRKLSKIISAVATQMESINIRSSLSFVWTAFASPQDVQAAHLGAAIESLRDSSCHFYKNKLSTQLVPKEIWKKQLKKPLLEAFDQVADNIEKVDIDKKSLERLRKKLENINYKSSNLQYDEFFDLLSLPVGEVEKTALQERNKPAHGHFYQDSDYHKLSMTIYALYSLFNRLVIKMTNASDCYIDYSTYGFPVRHIDTPLGGPEGDGKPAFPKSRKK